MHVMDGEVHICAHDARALWPLPYPAFWKNSDDVAFDEDNFWTAPVVEQEIQSLAVEDEDEEEDEDD